MNTAQNRFKYVGGSRTPLGRNRELFRSPMTGRAVIADKDALSAASLCRRFATVEEHLSHLKSLLGNATEPGTRWISALEDAVANGLVMSAQEIENYVLTKFPSHTQRRSIETVAIPTRNRPKMLERLLHSLANHLQEFGRVADVLVVDDSESPDMQTANLNVITSFSGHPYQKLRYGNRETRRQFAEKLAKESGVAPEIASFALGGSPLFPISTGATRNSILLETVGRCVLSMDDDVQCRFAAIPGAQDHVTFQGEAFSTWFLESRESINKCNFEPLDLLSAHEQIINMDRQSLDPQNLGALQTDTSKISSRFLKSIRRGNARIAVSLMGIVGDSGWDDPFGYWLLGDETVEQLTKTEQIYHAAMRNRLILNGPTSICVSDQCTCHSTCMGIDNSNLLPPFTPVMRGEDLIFGSLLVKCIPSALFGAIPSAILHEPGEKRRFTADAAVVRAGRFMTGETLALLARIEPIRGSSSAALMQSLGVHLQELKRLADDEFEAHVRSAVEPMVILCMQQLEAAIERQSRVSTFWLNDALEIRAAALAALNTRNYSAPSDLENAFGMEDGQARFRSLVEQFGLLLTAWPDLVRAAEKLHANETNICCITEESGRCMDEHSLAIHS